MGFIWNILITGLVVFAAAYFWDKVKVGGLRDAILVAILLPLLNFAIGWLIWTVLGVVNIITLGLLKFLLNIVASAAIIYILSFLLKLDFVQSAIDKVVKGGIQFSVSSPLAGLILAAAIALITTLL